MPVLSLWATAGSAVPSEPRQDRVPKAPDDGKALLLDCRNQVCPRPVFMTKMALAELGVGQALEVVVNDENSKQNVLRYLWNHGQEVVRSGADGPDFRMVVRKSTEKKADRPLPAAGPCGTRWD